MMRLLTALLTAILCASAAGQTPRPAEHSQNLGTDCAYENVYFGPVISAGGANLRPSFLGGVTVGQYFARKLGEGITGSPQFELGLIGPLPGGYPLDGMVGVDYMFANQIPRRNVYPFVSVGYTRLFATGNAANFGFGVDFGKDAYDRLIRVEVRDYFLFTGPQQHAIGLRIGLGKFIAD